MRPRCGVLNKLANNMDNCPKNSFIGSRRWTDRKVPMSMTVWIQSNFLCCFNRIFFQSVIPDNIILIILSHLALGARGCKFKSHRMLQLFESDQIGKSQWAWQYEFNLIFCVVLIGFFFNPSYPIILYLLYLVIWLWAREVASSNPTGCSNFLKVIRIYKNCQCQEVLPMIWVLND